MQAGLWEGAVAALAIAVFSGWRDWRRARRENLDAVGIVDWPTVQILALIVAAILASIAFTA
ncbi:MAG: hypothetical protein B7Y47_08270 [Sphingomonas sp. 28-63-12]|nr:MAG: hypothetical protein B7Y47_08270 [Sphingomonas sp. 28-63-12]